MNLDNNIISLIKNVVKTAQLVGVETVSIDNEYIRGRDENTVCLTVCDDIPELPFDSITMNRLSVFANRLSVVETRKNMQISADLKDEVVKCLTLSGDGTKVEYRCANPNLVEGKAPKKLGEVFKFRVPINAEAVTMLMKGQTAMGCDDVTFISNETGVSFELVDSNNDVFTFHFAEANDVQWLEDDEDASFVHRYPAKLLLSLFKQDTEGHFEVGQQGVLRYTLNGIYVNVFPKV